MRPIVAGDWVVNRKIFQAIKQTYTSAEILACRVLETRENGDIIIARNGYQVTASQKDLVLIEDA